MIGLIYSSLAFGGFKSSTLIFLWCIICICIYHWLVQWNFHRTWHFEALT